MTCPKPSHMIYSSTPEGITELRVIAEEVLHAHFDELNHKKDIEEVMCKHPSLMYALLKRKNKTPSPNDVPLPGRRIWPSLPLCHYCNLRPIEHALHRPPVCGSCYRGEYGVQERRPRY